MRRIEAISLNGKIRKSLIWNQSLKPKFLTVDSKRWTLYFANWKNLTSVDIYKLTYDSNSLATGQSILVYDAGNITSLAVDETFGRLFWSVIHYDEDKTTGSIYSISIKGKFSKILLIITTNFEKQSKHIELKKVNQY